MSSFMLVMIPFVIFVWEFVLLAYRIQDRVRQRRCEQEEQARREGWSSDPERRQVSISRGYPYSQGDNG